MAANLIRYGGITAGPEEVSAAVEVLRGQGWACGPVTEEFEAAAAAAQGRARALFVNSGSSGLLLALATLPRGSRVAMPALQFPTLYSAAVWCGLEPVLVDADDSLNMDPAGLLQLVRHHGHDLTAAAFVHMAGNPSGIREVAQLCRHAGVILIEDICEALGAEAGDVAAGNFGHIAVTSTHAAHQISTGEGGIVYTDDEDAWAKMRRLRDWGRAYDAWRLPGYYPGYIFSELGLNLHATDIQAAIGLVQLGRLDKLVAQRRINYSVLAVKTRDLPFTLPRVDEDCDLSPYAFPLLTDDRDALSAHLAAAGIESRPIVAGNMARQPAVRLDPGRFPVADDVFRRGLWVSVHPQLTGADLARIADSLHAFLER